MLPVFHVLVLGGRFMGAKSLQLWSSLCDPMDCSLPACPVHRIFQARILEQVAISYSRGSSQPRDQIRISYVSCIGRWVLYHKFKGGTSSSSRAPGSRVLMKMPT